MAKLNKKQKDFCEEYIANGYNATQAYLKSYGCAYETATVESCRLMKKEHIREYIHELQKEAFAASAINAERIALKLGEIAFADKEDEFYTTKDKLKALDLLQKQLQLQTQRIEAEVSTDINITIEE